MATEKEANLAREQHADSLVQLGAHSIGVDEFVHEGKKTFGVVAYVDGDPASFPGHLSVKHGKTTTLVPLKTKSASPFKAE